MSFVLEFKSDACCGGYIHAEVEHANGVRSIVEEVAPGQYNVQTLQHNAQAAPWGQGLTMDQVQARLASDALIPA